MKFLHLGDLHLGKSLGEYSLIDDQRYILDQITKMAGQAKADGDEVALLIAGDVFDRLIPSEAAVNLLDQFLFELSKEKISTFVISGNHDSDERLHYGSRFFERSGVYICSVFDGTLKSYTLKDAYGEINVWMLPFVKASQVRHFFPDEKIETYEEAVRVILRHAPIDSKQRNVLVAHQFVCGQSIDPILAGSEGVLAQSVGLVEKIGADVFDDFDYVALGHIHTPQHVGRETVRYSGSPLKYSLAEARADKFVPLITMREKGKVGIELLPLQPKRDLRHIKGPMKELLDPANVMATDDFIYATLTDEDSVPEAMSIFRATYPNMVRLDYDNAHTREIALTDAMISAEVRSFSEMIADFYTKMYGCEISEEEMQIMKQIAGKAGVASEAD